MNTMLLVMAAIVASIGAYPYIASVRRGSVRPRLVSWGVWMVLAAITTVSALTEGQVASAVLSMQALICCTAVVVLGWRQGATKIGQLDIICLVGAVLGIISLVFLQNATVALLVSVAVDAVAFVPTLLHAWTNPDEESIMCFACSAAAAVLVLIVAVSESAGLVGLAYPVYSVVFNSAMALLLVVSRMTPSAQYGYGSEEV